MALILALSNQHSVVVASDCATISDGSLRYEQFMNVPGRSILLVAGNLDAVRRPIEDTVIPKLTASTSAAVLAQLLQAALIMEVAPRLSDIAGRVELIVAGIDPVRHTEQPGLYYLDSAQDFRLKFVREYAVAGGSTAVVDPLLQGRDLSAASTEELIAVAKECLSATKLRWPAALGAHQRFGIITPTQIRILDF